MRDIGTVAVLKPAFRLAQLIVLDVGLSTGILSPVLNVRIICTK